MVIEAQAKFAKRVATWMMLSDLSSEEIEIRLSCFDDDFNELIIQESRKLRVA